MAKNLALQESENLFKLGLENDLLPPSKEDRILHWTQFTRTIYSDDLEMTKDLINLPSKTGDRLIDLRPYMIDNPFKVSTNDYLNKCVNLFRSMNLRHLLVVHPGTGQLKGIITRKDLFRWMDI